MLDEISTVRGEPSNGGGSGSNSIGGGIASGTGSGGGGKPGPPGFRGGTAAARAILAGRGDNARAKQTDGGEETESLGKPPVNVKAKPEPPSKLPKLDIQTFANSVTVGLFGLAAVATGHEHWLKEHEEVLEFTGPLTAWINQLPPKTVKKLTDNLAPAMMLGGLFGLVAPDIATEIALRRAERANNRHNAAEEGRGKQRPANQPQTAGIGGMVGGGGAGQGSSPEQSITIPVIPSSSPLADTFDV